MCEFPDQLKQHFPALQRQAQLFSVRYVHRAGQRLCVRKNVAEPPSLISDEGAMLA
ncbi:TldD/PmbA family protein, partial [Pseudomonas syringae]|nr:TldD/PmbA family protein [Pseudomonas syringae]